MLLDNIINKIATRPTLGRYLDTLVFLGSELFEEIFWGPDLPAHSGWILARPGRAIASTTAVHAAWVWPPRVRVAGGIQPLYLGNNVTQPRTQPHPGRAGTRAGHASPAAAAGSAVVGGAGRAQRALDLADTPRPSAPRACQGGTARAPAHLAPLS
jgi:hypothetical protein